MALCQSPAATDPARPDRPRRQHARQSPCLTSGYRLPKPQRGHRHPTHQRGARASRPTAPTALTAARRTTGAVCLPDAAELHPGRTRPRPPPTNPPANRTQIRTRRRRRRPDCAQRHRPPATHAARPKRRHLPHPNRNRQPTDIRRHEVRGGFRQNAPNSAATARAPGRPGYSVCAAGGGAFGGRSHCAAHAVHRAAAAGTGAVTVSHRLQAARTPSHRLAIGC